MLKQHERKEQEFTEWKSVVDGFLAEKDKQAKVRKNPPKSLL